MKYYLVAGETSGDLHGSNLIQALKAKDAHAQFRIVGGDLMQEASGQRAVLHTSQMSFMGFVEVVANLFTILRNLKAVKGDILQYRPDCVILIDFPGFNLKIAEFVKKHRILTCYYISPKVWAWNQKRVLKIKRVVDRMFCILPFEKAFYADWGMTVDYVGNPLLDELAKFKASTDFRVKYHLDEKPIVALLPGSRKMEITKLLPLMAKMQDRFPTYQFVIAGASNFSTVYYHGFLSGRPIPVVFGATYDLLAHAEAAVVASGTATLETALLKVPEVVVYKANPISVWVARRLIKVKYISLVNLIMNVLVVRELIQEDFNEGLLYAELDLLLHDTAYRQNMIQNFNGLIRKMGTEGTSDITADLIVRATAQSLEQR